MIRKAMVDDLDNIMLIIADVIKEMKIEGSDQWNENYPKKENFLIDIKNGDLYVDEENGDIMGFICINNDEALEYETLNWSKNNEETLIIHRLAINSRYRKAGLGTKLINFAENFARENHINYIKTDTYSLNEKMNNLFDKLNYKKVGEMVYHGKENKFYCYEKILK